MYLHNLVNYLQKCNKEVVIPSFIYKWKNFEDDEWESAGKEHVIWEQMMKSDEDTDINVILENMELRISENSVEFDDQLHDESFN